MGEEIIIPGLGDSNTIQTPFHSLFVTEAEPVLAELSFPEPIIDGTIKEVMAIIKPARNIYTLYLSEMMNEMSEFHAVLNKLREATPVDELVVYISSGGGIVAEGLTLISIMSEYFHERVTTQVDSGASSMAATLFACGDKRVAYEYAELMYHTYSGGAIGNGRKMKDRIDFADRNTNRFFKDIVVGKGFMDESEYQRLQDGKEYYFDTRDMAERGIATHIIVSGVELEAAEYVEYIDSGFTIEEYVEYVEIP